LRTLCSAAATALERIVHLWPELRGPEDNRLLDGAR
jgi:hypothetical protein